ncbi:MAG: hypothetical protein HQM16_16495 [Deltaproteobacteria bacterium]|nr:hypothetical protein [Deltaproteobacteria bacterium]
MKENNICIKKNIVSFLILVLLGFLAVGSVDTDTSTQNVQSQTPSYTLTARQLYHEYDSNEVAADAKYKGQVVVVSGKIQAIGKDIMDDAYVVLGGGDYFDGVQCTFTEGQKSSVAGLSKGQQVAIKGEVAGKMMNVLVNKASLQ